MESRPYSRGLVASVVVLAYFLLSPVFLPIVQAQAGPLTRSGSLLAVDDTIIIQPDEGLNYSLELNVANTTDYDLLDYNLSWEPFFANNTDLQGVLVHSQLSPLVFDLNVTNQTMSVGSFFRVLPETIMDGASEVWFRLPVSNIPINSSMALKIARVTNINAFNLSYFTWGIPIFNNSDDIRLVHSVDIVPTGINYTDSDDFSIPNTRIGYVRQQNVSVRGVYDYNFTYVKACFGMFPNEWYYVQVDIYVPYDADMQLLVSPSDFGNDERYNSWFWINGTNYYIPADLDMPFLCTRGVSNGITGIGTNLSYAAGASSQRFHINASIPIEQTIDTGDVSYFEIVVPIKRNTAVAESSTAIATYVTFYSTADETTPFLIDYTSYYNYDGTYMFILKDIDITPYDGTYIDHIRFDIVLNYVESDEVALWGCQDATGWDLSYGYTDLYWTGYSDSDARRDCIVGERQWFVPFGYYGLTNAYWGLTNETIMTIPVYTPNTPEGIIEKIQQFELYLEDIEDDNGNAYSTNQSRGYWATLMDIAEILFFVTVEFGWDVLKYAIGQAANWLWANVFSPIFEFIYGIVLWVWKAITWFIDALEWFTYWAVRIIYSFSIGIVYMVNVFGVISINSALLQVARTGNGKEFVRAFNAGWKFIFAIISLLLSLAIMAITIVSAVVPF